MQWPGPSASYSGCSTAMPCLRKLSLTYGFPNSAISADLSVFKNLEALELWNALSNKIPVVIGKLTNLTELSLYGCKELDLSVLKPLENLKNFPWNLQMPEILNL
jgi:hypothetical protein